MVPNENVATDNQAVSTSMAKDTPHVSTTVTVLRTEHFREIKSFDAAAELLRESGKGIVAADAELGDGFELVKDLRQLVGVPMLCVDVKFLISDKYTDKQGHPAGYIVARCVTKDDRKVVIDDGSTGISQQLWTYKEENDGAWPTLWAHGLRESTFYVDKAGNVVPRTTVGATEVSTFYIDTSS